MNAVVGRLAEVVAHRAEHDGHLAPAIEVVDHRSSPIDHHQRVDPHVALGMPLRFLRAADEGRHFAEQPRHDAEFEAEREADRRTRRPQQELLELGVDPLARQIVERQRRRTRRASPRPSAA